MTSSSSFLMDDQSDADFFDKLVDDDDDNQVPRTENLKNNNLTDGAEIESDAASVDNTSDILSKLMLDEIEDNNSKPVFSTAEREEVSRVNEIFPIESELTRVPGENNASLAVEGHYGVDGPAEDFSSAQKQLSSEDVVKEEVLVESAENAFTKSGNNEEVGFSFSDTDDGMHKGTDSLDSKLEQTGSKIIFTNVREVQWSNFNTTSTHSDLGGFGSYSDFYTDFPDGSTQQAGNSGLNFFSTVNYGSEVEHISDSTPHQTSQVSENGTLDAFVAATPQPQVNSFIESKSFNGHMSDVQNQYNKGELEGHFTNSVSPDQSNSTGDSQDAHYNQWESAYPGWRYDHATGEWHQVEEYETTAVGSSIVEGAKQDGSRYNLQSTQSSVSYSSWQTQGSQIHHAQSAGGSADQVESINSDVSTAWGHGSAEHAVPNWQQDISTPHSQTTPQNQENVYYDPQYPGWYYDLVAQEWRQVTVDGQMDYGQSAHIAGAMEVSTFGGQQTLPEQTKVVNGVYNGTYAYNDPSLDGQNNRFQGFQTQSARTSLSALSNDYSMSNGQWENSISQANMYDSNQANHGGVSNNNVIGEKLHDALVGNMSTVYNPAASIQDESDHTTSFYVPSSTVYNPAADLQGKSYQATNFNAPNSIVFNPAASIQGQLDQATHFLVPNSTVYNTDASTQGQSNQASNFHVPNSTFSYNQSDQGISSHHSDIDFQSSNSGQNIYSYRTQQMDQNKGSQASDDYYRNIHTSDYSHQMYQARQLANHTPLLNSAMEGRSSEGRPPHALVTFGFGGKIVVFNPKNNLSMASSYGSQDNIGGVITVHSIGQLVKENSGNGSEEIENSYFDTLCRQAFSSPLVGGSVASKEIYKWIDERIANCESAISDFGNPEIMRMLLCSLKIFCQHYGKLRSAFGSGGASQEIDGPEAALTKLFASANSTGYGLNKFSVVTQCLQTVPSESQLQSTAFEMKNLLVAGKRKEALLLAQQGQLWGPALVLAWQLGQQFYVDTVKLMAQEQFLPGTPLRTLCLILAGQPAEVFSTSSSAAFSNSHSGKAIGLQQSDQDCMSGMLNNWKENLAIIVANRTQGDERVIVHLGDCLWKERGEVAAAHTCYLVAEANFEYFSDSARLCLLGADHWKFPRTYASPEAIQRTELYEYAKLLGNPQYILLPFQPYKLMYAQMLAEVGKVSDSLRYCQAVSKILKNAGRASEVEACRQLASSMEDRLRIHTQGGYSSNLAPSKLVGRFLTTIDRGIHKIIGAPPPPMPSDSQTSLQNGDLDSYSTVPKLANATPLIATPLMPSVSMEPISEWTGNNSKGTMQTRSVSEPNFIRSPQENQSSFPSSKAESSPSKAQNNAATSGGQSRFGRFGAQFFQKAVGLIAKAHHNEAKLGEKNKFHYDEKLKRWVEEGAAPPPEEPALSAPPTSAVFISNSQTSESGYNIGSALNGQNVFSNGGSESRSTSSTEQVSGMPPVPPSMNQFSARNRLQGVRSRYVDTFNKSGGTVPSKSFNSPVIPAARSGGLPAGANFFVPTPAAFDSNSIAAADISEENSSVAACTSMEDVPNGPSNLCSESSGSEEKLSKGASSFQRFSSAGDVARFANKGFSDCENRSVALSSHSRAASWSGEYPNSLKNSNEPEALRTPDRNQFSIVSNVSGYFSYPTKLDAQKPGSGGYVYSTLPSPPPHIEPQHSSTAIKKSLVADRGSTDRMYNSMDYGLQTGFQADGFGDELQEVAL